MIIFKRLYIFVLSFFSSVYILAQEKGVDVNINVKKEGGEWYQQTWVWVVAAAVFILLLAAILRGGGKKES